MDTVTTDQNQCEPQLLPLPAKKTSAVTTCSNNQCAVKESIVVDEFACSPPKK